MVMNSQSIETARTHDSMVSPLRNIMASSLGWLRSVLAIHTFILVSCTSLPANGAEFVLHPVEEGKFTIAIVGPINPGDFDKMVLAVDDRVIVAAQIFSNSGNISESMVIGRWLRNHFVSTSTLTPFEYNRFGGSDNSQIPDWWPKDSYPEFFDYCSTSCFLIWVAGVQRLGGGCF